MSYLDRIEKIKALVFDVDGVLTDGTVVLLPDGQQMRHMHSKDGYALQLAVKKGYTVGIITGGNSVQVQERLQALGINDIYLKSSHKDESLEDLRMSHHLELENIMYMGDDIPDLCAMKDVGLATCPGDASPEVKNISHFVSKANGGKGCVRDIIEKVLRAQGNWYNQEEHPEKYAEFTW